jgi:hypothetical protein
LLKNKYCSFSTKDIVVPNVDRIPNLWFLHIPS